MFVVLVLAHGSSKAATIQTECCGSHAATGIENLQIGSDLFDIDFVFGSFTEVYQGDETVLSANFLGGVFQEFSSSPVLIDSVADQNGQLHEQFFGPDEIFSQFTIGISGFIFVEYGFAGPFGNLLIDEWVGCGRSPLCGLAGADAERLWVVPTHVSAVPIPAALPLFAGGLGLLGFLGWRRKRIFAS